MGEGFVIYLSTWTHRNNYCSLLFTPFTVTQPKFIPDCLRQWNFGLYVSGFWHIHAKTPRGIVDMNSNQKHPGNWNSALQYLV